MRLLACFAFLALVSASPSIAENARTILVLDASGSMWGQINGRAKIEIAREVVGQLVDKLPAETEIGLVAYGHREKGACDDIELLIPPGKIDRESFKKSVDGLMPKGMTPLTDAVVFAAEELRSTEQKATVILVTDGEETCDRDPCEAAAKLEAAGIDFTAHVVAFDLGEKSAKSIECLAKTTGGLFLKADNASTLAAALEMAVEPEPADAPPAEPTEATVSGPASVVAGSVFEAKWTGPDGKGDYVEIAMKGAKGGTHRNYEYTRSGNPLQITAPVEEGAAELRYVHARSGTVLARADISVVPAEVSLKGPSSAVAGSPVAVNWTGPDNAGDYLTIVPKSLEDGKFERYAYTRDGSPAEVPAPMEPGEGEIRYMAGQGGKVLARVGIRIEPAEASLKAAEATVAGANVVVEWTGPNNAGDYITIVPKDAEDGKYGRYAYTRDGSPAKVPAPIEPGEGEIRYMAGQGGKVLARTAIRIEPAAVSLKAAAKAVAGAPVKIEWTGPNNDGDYITIVAKDAEDGKYGRYAYTRDGSPCEVEAPEEAGACEIRYMSGQGGAVLGRIPIEVGKKE